MRAMDTGREERLRAACDRCHELKNRCVRAGGPDSRCSRCERLDIDCVYRNVNRLGRPRTRLRRTSAVTAQPLRSPEASDRDGDGLRQQQQHQHQHQQQQHQHQHQQQQQQRQQRQPCGGGAIAAPSYQDKALLGATMPATPDTHAIDQESVDAANWPPLDQSPPELMDLLTLAEEGAEHHAEMDWNLSTSADLSLSKPTGHQMLHTPSTIERMPAPNSASTGSDPGPWTLDHSSSSLSSSSTAAAPNISTSDAVTTLDSLSCLQSQLDSLLLHSSGQNGLAGSVDEGLQVAKSLLELLQAYNRCLSSSSPPNTDLAAAEGVRDQTHSVPALASNGNIRQQNHLPSLSLIVFLQAMTCYSYVLEVLGRLVDLLQNQSGEPRPISLGLFNLASQPGLNREIIFRIMLNMVQRLRVFIHGRAPFGHSKGQQHTALDTGGGGVDVGQDNSRDTSPMAISLPGVAYLVQEQERVLVERLTESTSSAAPEVWKAC